MLIKGKINLKDILIIVILVIFVVGGISGYYSWRISRETDIKEISIAAGVVPHHLLAKDLIEDFFSYIASKEKPETIILLSPDHFNTGSILGNSFITLETETQEFYGAKVDSSLINALSFKNNLILNSESINFDHGITDLIPFIKKYFIEAKITPFIIPSSVSLEDTDQFVTSLDSLVSLKTVVIASVDFSHYLPVSGADFHDVKSIRTLINFERQNLESLEVDSWQALYIARAFAHLRDREFPKIIGHLNSMDFFEDKNAEETTSYFSVVFEERNSKKAEEIKELNGKTILFIGDIMLDRGVEYLINKNSAYYPFEKINQALKGIDIVVGNLEGPIVKDPPYFSDDSLKFAFSSEVINGLVFSNFNLLSLANNHTFDMNEDGFEETKEILQEAGINFVGHPVYCDKEFLYQDNNLIFLAFNKTFPFNCSDDETVKVIEETKKSNPDKFLIVIIHWGEEYQYTPSILQKQLAHRIIEAGANLIIGSHSHIVQGIEEYKGKLIFYSLGNFIFDQYFSKEVQQGLILGLEVYPQKLIYRLFPVESHLSQPSLMQQKEAEEFLGKLASRSYSQLVGQIKDGIIKIER